MNYVTEGISLMRPNLTNEERDNTHSWHFRKWNFSLPPFPRSG